MTKTSRRAKASPTTTKLGKQTASTSVQSPQVDTPPVDIARAKAIKLIKSAFAQLDDAVNKFYDAGLTLHGYEHCTSLRDASQIAGWRVQDARATARRLLNAVADAPAPQSTSDSTF